uniref:Uncharacterized protein n=1 Tax=Anopheles funestus TaxID=62324 RepID=A0A182RWN7_ANOFN
MSRPFVMLACFAFLANVCVSVSGLSETPADVPEHPVDGIARPDDDRPNYMAFNENAFNDNDLPPPSPSPTDDSRMPPGGHGTDGLARGLYSWGGMPRWRISPELLDGLRAALEVENDMFMPHNEQLFRTAQNDNEENGRVEFGFGAERNLPKRAPTGFTGMRGRRFLPGLNGTISSAGQEVTLSVQLEQSSVTRWSKTLTEMANGLLPDSWNAWKESFDNALDERWSLDELNSNQMAKEYPNFLVLDPAYGPSMHLNAAPPKRVPNGFMGLRGK